MITDVFRGILGAGAEQQIERITKAFTLAVMPGSMVVVDQDSDAEAMASAMASNKKRKLPLGDQGDQGDQGFLPSSLGGASASAIQRAKRSVGRKTPRVDALTCALTLGLLVRPVTLPSGKSFSLGALTEHFDTCKAQRKDRTCPVTRGPVPSDWTPNENTDLRDMTEGLVLEITDEAAEETVPEAAAAWADLLCLCAEYHATKATVATVATVVATPTVTVDSASLARGAKTLTIRGTGFDPANLTNKVRLSGGATGVVTAATATTLTVSLRTWPAAGTLLKAAVTSFGGTSGAAVTVARIVRNPTVQSSTDQMSLSSTTITIRGLSFDPSYKNNVVTFNLGAVGYVTSATKNTLVVKFTTPPSVGRLKAVVTSFGGSSNAVQVATVRQATSTSSSYSLSGETDGGAYAQSFSYTGINNGYTVELISGYSSVNLYNFKTYNSNDTLATGISWSGTTTSNNYSVTMTAVTTETNVNGYFTFDATLPGIITSYNVYDSTTLDSTTLIGSGDKST